MVDRRADQRSIVRDLDHYSDSKVSLNVAITDLVATDDSLVRAVAAMLVDGFRQNAPEAFPDVATALAEWHESFANDRISRVALDDEDNASPASRE